MKYAQIVLALDEMSAQMKTERKIKPDVDRRIQFVSLTDIASTSTPDPAGPPAKEYPTTTGTWHETPTIPVTITQKGNQFTALCKYLDDKQNEIRWRMTGTISKDGQIRGKLVHTKTPTKACANQTRTGVVSADGTSIKGHAAFDGGGGSYFEWKLEIPSIPTNK